MNTTTKRKTAPAIALIALLAALCLVLALAPAAKTVRADTVYTIGEGVDFTIARSAWLAYDGLGAETLQNGDTRLTLKSDGGATRAFYGEGTTPYAVDMTDFEMKLKVQDMLCNDTGTGRISIGFMESIDAIPGYWNQSAGNGLVITLRSGGWWAGFPVDFQVVLTDVNGGALALEDGSYIAEGYNSVGHLQRSTGDWNTVTLLDQELTLTLTESGSYIVLDMRYADGVTSTAVNIPKTALNFDYTDIALVFNEGEGGTAYNGEVDIVFDINSIVEPNTTAYLSTVAAKKTAIETFVTDTDTFKQAITDGAAITVDNIKAYVKAYNALDLSGMRTHDAYVYGGKITAIDLTDINTYIATRLDDVFAGFPAETEINASNRAAAEDVLEVYHFLPTDLTADFTELADTLIFRIFLLDNAGQQAAYEDVVAKLNALSTTYATLTEGNAEAAYQAYLAALSAYRAASVDIRNIVDGTKLSAFRTRFQMSEKNIRGQFYKTDGTYFTNDCGQYFAGGRAVKNGSDTEITLLDFFAYSRLRFGEAGKSYTADLSDFTFEFTIDEINKNGRFGLMFTDSANGFVGYPVGETGAVTKGYFLMFRMSNGASVEVAGGRGQAIYLPTEYYGSLGNLTSGGTVVGKKITVGFEKNISDHIILTVAIEGGNSVSYDFNDYFTANGIDTTALHFSLFTGEYGNNNYYDGSSNIYDYGTADKAGDDIRLTVHSVAGAAEDDYAALLSNVTGGVNAYKTLTETTAGYGAGVTKAQLKAFYSADKPNVSALRSIDKTARQSVLDALAADLAAIQTNALSMLATEFAGLGSVAVDASNVADIRDTLTVYNALPPADTAAYAATAAAVAEKVYLYENPAVQNVIDEIAALPAKEAVTLANEAAVTAARGHFAALAPSQKQHVSNYTRLTDAEEKIAEIEALDLYKDAAKTELNAYLKGTTVIGNYTGANLTAITTARSEGCTAIDGAEHESAVDGALAAAKGIIDDVNTDAEIKAEADAAAALSIQNQIAALPAAGSLTLTDKAAVTSARTAYNALTADQKALVTNESVLTAAEAKIAALEKDAADAAAALTVQNQIAALPAAGSLTLTDKAAVASARTAYNALTADQKALVTNENVLTAAETKIAALEKDADDAAAALSVQNQIAALPAADNLVLTDKAAVALARTAYNALTADQKTLVTNENVLTAAEAKIAALEEAANNPPAKSGCGNAAAVTFALLAVLSAVFLKKKY
ncbi:hypothetical protein FACS1894211_03940 [Clostridia bacterium]|nr:hypothetical protein FACS1894211_03940 [Clostridia bacterium]